MHGRLSRQLLGGRFARALLGQSLLIKSVVHVAIVDGHRRHASSFPIVSVTRTLHLALLFDDALRVGVYLRSECLVFGLFKVTDRVLTT